MNTSKLWVNNDKRRYYRVLVYKDLLGDLGNGDRWRLREEDQRWSLLMALKQ